MRWPDLLRLIVENLGRRKARVALTAVGVVIGTAAVLVLVSLGVGLQQNAAQQLGGIGDLTRIEVFPGMGFEGRGGGGPGVAVEIVGPGGQPPGATLVTDRTLEELAAIPGVTGVYPRDWLQAGGLLRYGRMEAWASVMGVPPAYLTETGLRAAAGELSLTRGTMVIGSMVAGSFYEPQSRPGREPPPPPDLLGQTLRLTLIRYAQDGTESRRTVPVRVVGVLASGGETDWMMLMSLDEITEFNGWAMGRRVDRNRDGYMMAVVRAEDPSIVLEVRDRIVEMGYQAYTPQEFVQGINAFFIVLQVIFGGVGAIALLVAAIGIANTMAMAILERTREIGLMKALGATNRDVLAVFLGEAAGIGFLGGLGGVLLGWSVGQVLNMLAVAYLAGQAAQTGGPPPTVAVATPTWLPPFSVLFATAVGLLSGLYPALRAAGLVPVTALKYE